MDRAGPARLKTVESPLQKYPEACVWQPTSNLLVIWEFFVEYTFIGIWVNPFYEGVRETHLFATTPLSIKQKIICRPGRGWGWGPRFDARGARGVYGAGAPLRDFSALIA